MNDPSNSWQGAPLPEVPIAPPVPPERDLPSAVRAAALLMVFIGAINLVREGVYTLGDITYYGRMSQRDWLADIIGVLLFALCYAIAKGLTRLEHWAWWLCLIGCPLYALRMVSEILFVLNLRAQGYPHTEFQFTWLVLLFGMLAIAPLYLLSQNGRRAFKNR